MIESILFFLLGFLCAGFLALMIAPAVWRRAVILTRKRIEASVPLTMGEIQADKDRMRAEFAMSTRRLEMSVKAFKEKAASQVMEITRSREELKRLAEEYSAKNEALSELEARDGELRAELRRREEQLAKMSEMLSEAERQIEIRARDLEKMTRLYDDASFSSSTRQIELATRETEVEKLSGDITNLKLQRNDVDRRVQDLVGEVKTAREALKAEKKRVADLEKKIERLMTSLNDRDERLDRREKEFARLRDEIKERMQTEEELNASLLAAQQGKIEVEAKIADLQLQTSGLIEKASGRELDKARERFNAERDRLEHQIAGLLSQNEELKDQMVAFERSKTYDWNDDRRESAMLREQMNDLAAEVVNLTAMLDGPDSPIKVALAAPQPSTAGASNGNVASLADRVRALQKAASSAAAE